MTQTTTTQTEQTYRIHYDYNGGSGVAVVTAETQDDAIRAGMQQATARYASDPATPCTFRSAYRTLTYAEMMSAPNHGVRRVVAVTWEHGVDTGGDWLIVSRGHSMTDGRDYWTDTAQLVRTARSERVAQIMAARARASLRRQVVSGVVDIVRRDSVELVASSGPVGCHTGDGSASV